MSTISFTRPEWQVSPIGITGITVTGPWISQRPFGNGYDIGVPRTNLASILMQDSKADTDRTGGIVGQKRAYVICRACPAGDYREWPQCIIGTQISDILDKT